MLVIGTLLVTRPGAANAHPLGNFTINHYTRIDVSESGIELFRVLDMAEIPTVQERQAIDADNDGEIDGAEAETWAVAKAADLAAGMALLVDGTSIGLVDHAHDVTFPEGQGGLSTLRLTVTYRADLPDGWHDASPRIQYTDDNYADRIGWREVIVRAAPASRSRTAPSRAQTSPRNSRRTPPTSSRARSMSAPRRSPSAPASAYRFRQYIPSRVTPSAATPTARSPATPTSSPRTNSRRA